MNLIFSDLDRTLIYSYKQEIAYQKILVEEMDGKALSYMTQNTHRLLIKGSFRLPFIPVTTRSVGQYGRIQVEGWQPQYALAANGGVLLIRGKPADWWYRESLDLIREAQDEMKRGRELLEGDEEVTLGPRYVDGLFVFAKSGKAERTLTMLKQNLDPDLVSAFRNGGKVYIIPKKLNKGMAVKRARRWLHGDKILCAGDSALDIPMLELADLAIYPENLAGGRLKTHKNKIVVPERELLSDVVMKKAAEFIKI